MGWIKRLLGKECRHDWYFTEIGTNRRGGRYPDIVSGAIIALMHDGKKKYQYVTVVEKHCLECFARKLLVYNHKFEWDGPNTEGGGIKFHDLASCNLYRMKKHDIENKKFEMSMRHEMARKAKAAWAEVDEKKANHEIDAMKEINELVGNN